MICDAGSEGYQGSFAVCGEERRVLIGMADAGEVDYFMYVWSCGEEWAGLD